MLFNTHEHTFSVCLDFDGCTDSLPAREILIDHLVRLLKAHPHVTTLEISVGSTRGYAFINDFYTTHLHHLEVKQKGYHKEYQSCAILQTEFMPALRARLAQENLSSISVQFDEFTMADVLNEQKRGVNFRMMQKFQSQYATWASGQTTFGLQDPSTGQLVFELKAKPLPLAPGDENPIECNSGNALHCLDENKLLMLWMQMHDKAVTLRAKNLTQGFILNFFDDRSDITRNAWLFYQNNPHLMPRNCRLRIDPLDIAHSSLPFDDATADRYTIQGTGPVNAHFAEDIRTVARSQRTTLLPSTEQTQQVVAALKTLRAYACPDENALVIRSYPEEACHLIAMYFPPGEARQKVEAAQETISQTVSSEDKKTLLDLIAKGIMAEVNRRTATESFDGLKVALQSTHSLRFSPKQPPAPPFESPVTVLDSSNAVNQTWRRSQKTAESLTTTIIPFSGESSLEL